MAGFREETMASRVIGSLRTYLRRRLEALFARIEDEIARDEFMRPQIVPPSGVSAVRRTRQH